MSQPTDQIAHWRKMANDDPENDLAHYRLGQELMKVGQYEEAIKSFRRTLELSPEFSKVFQLLGTCLIQLGRRDEAVAVLRQGFDVADARGDNMPRDEMARMLTELGEPAPVSKRTAAAPGGPAGEGGFRCQSPRHLGYHARRLPAPPMNDELGQRIYETVCIDCWNDWLRNYSIKVINELRLDLSTEIGQMEYDRYMREFLGLD
ncbi:MAG TPA: Fe(2+)-trafficking protein [Gemmataceae bacterium]|nr:Fe(2+)-trafficking protein [Gemmataceae bacterium]